MLFVRLENFGTLPPAFAFRVLPPISTFLSIWLTWLLWNWTILWWSCAFRYGFFARRFRVFCCVLLTYAAVFTARAFAAIRLLLVCSKLTYS